MDLPDLGVVIPAWRRRAYLPAVVESLRRQTLPPRRMLVVGSQDRDMEAIALGLSCEYLDAPNEPLSDKWNAAFEQLAGCDFAMIVGSDNLLSKHWVEVALAHFEDDTILVGSRDQYVLQLDSMQLIHFLGYPESGRKDPMGPGRIIAKAALDAVGWRPLPEGHNSSLDWLSSRRLQQASPGGSFRQFPSTAAACFVDIKDAHSMTRFNELRGLPISAPEEWLRARFPARAVDVVLAARRDGVTAPPIS